MKHLTLAGLAYVALVVQASVVPAMASGALEPRFLWLAALGAVLLFDGAAGLVWAAVLGLLSDCLCPGPLGIDLTLAALSAALVQRLIPSESRRSFVVVAATVGVGLMVLASGSFAARLWLAGTPVDPAHVLTISFGTALSTLACGTALWLASRVIAQLARELTGRHPAAMNRN